MSHLRVALEFGEEISEEELHTPYKNNPLRYIALRIAIIAILVVIAVLARKRFLDLQDFTGATAHTTSCLLMPLIIYMRVSWRTMSIFDKGASMIVIVGCAFAGCYVMIYAGKHLFTPSDDDTLFPYCEEEFMNTPYYIRNNSTN
ncbi:Amino Acid/Auxin Permease (AAAP) Family [Phytophthora cinnamomi]|uniref:Amino Acid/Auxin Permease (AAAP) Family n=1 Tax=Phytophthora cinnamomi TaxID=4785 RepID=UPI00355A4409|nr:Amino Acid/Auxin Permease (AAAP) Family [Phytophthora cinnamomi]